MATKGGSAGMHLICSGMGSGVGVMLLHRQLLSPSPWVWPTKKILRRQQQEHNESTIIRRRQVVLHHLDHIRCCCSGSAPPPRPHPLLQNRRWMLPKPDVQIHHISLSLLEAEDEYEYEYHHFSSSNITSPPPPPSPFSFYVIRDDLLHPLVNGNKARKLDAILPLLQHHSVTDVVTCGGCQSAHTAATAVSCSERGIKSHLLLRGEQPDIPTGYNLLSLMYANHVVYVPRSVYANRDEMLREHARLVAGAHASVRLLDDLLHHRPCSTTQEQCTRNVVILNEGAGGTTALLGVIRLVQYLSQSHIFGTDKPIKIVLDAGTGTTAIGLGIGVKCLGLPWKIVAVMLADTRDGYKKREKQLISDFKRDHGSDLLAHDLDGCDNGVVQWVERIHFRKFGKILQGEINICRKVAQQTGILVDPIYTLAAWEHAVLLCQADFESSKVVMLHTGGTLGMFGLAQRFSLHLLLTANEDLWSSLSQLYFGLASRFKDLPKSISPRLAPFNLISKILVIMKTDWELYPD